MFVTPGEGCLGEEAWAWRCRRLQPKYPSQEARVGQDENQSLWFSECTRRQKRPFHRAEAKVLRQLRPGQEGRTILLFSAC